MITQINVIIRVGCPAKVSQFIISHAKIAVIIPNIEVDAPTEMLSGCNKQLKMVPPIPDTI